MISGCFPQVYRLRKSSQFQALSNNSHSKNSHSKNVHKFHGNVIFIVYKTNDLIHSRLGITVTKKYGDAVRRNKFKRHVREVFRQSKEKACIGIDIHVRPNANKSNLPKKRGKNSCFPSYCEVAQDFIDFFDKLTRKALVGL